MKIMLAVLCRRRIKYTFNANLSELYRNLFIVQSYWNSIYINCGHMQNC